jgi:hypothetical protein
VIQVHSGIGSVIPPGVLAIAGQTRNVGNPELGGEIPDHAGRNVRWRTEKVTEEPDSAELNREAELVMIAVSSGDELPGVGIEMEVLGQLL